MDAKPDPVTACFRALANPARRAVVERLARGDAGVSELAEAVRLSLPAMARHLAILEGARLVERAGPGRYPRCRLGRAGLRKGAAWFEGQQAAWDLRLEHLARHLAAGRR